MSIRLLQSLPVADWFFLPSLAMGTSKEDSLVTKCLRMVLSCATVGKNWSGNKTRLNAYKCYVTISATTGNENRIGCSPDNFSPLMRYIVWEWDYRWNAYLHGKQVTTPAQCWLESYLASRTTVAISAWLSEQVWPSPYKMSLWWTLFFIYSYHKSFAAVILGMNLVWYGVSKFGGMEWWNGIVEWTTGMMECFTGHT